MNTLILQVLAHVTVVVALAALAARVLKRRSASARHGVWLCALIAVLASPALTLFAWCWGPVLANPPWPLSTQWDQGDRHADRSGVARPESSMGVEDAVATPFADSGRATQTSVRLDPAGEFASERVASVASRVEKPTSPVMIERTPRAPAVREAFESTGVAPRTAVSRIRFPSWTAAVSFLWLAGTLGLLARLVHGGIVLAHIKRSGRAIDAERFADVLEQVRTTLGLAELPPIMVSSAVGGPAAAGLLRPRVVLPLGLLETLSAESLHDVLVHECAHVLRRDPWVGLLQRVAEALYWPHPLVHLLNRRLARAREEVCDDYVLQSGDPCRYARTLVDLAELLRPARMRAAALGLIDARWRLEDRVAGLLDRRRNAMTRTSRGALGLWAIVFAAAGIAVAGVRPEAAPTASQEDRASRTTTEPRFDDPPTLIEGVVVDEAGQPVAGADVNVTWFRKAPQDVKTAADGTFSLRIGGPILPMATVHASADKGARQGFAEYREAFVPHRPPVRVVLKPVRTMHVRVLDALDKPVPRAAVEVQSSGNGPIASAETDERGTARFTLPVDAKVEQVLALKPRVGFDVFENYRSWPHPPVSGFPEQVTLVLDGARNVAIKTVDASGKPVSGVALRFSTVTKPDKLSYANLSGSDITSATTGADGVARFDWFPRRLGSESEVMTSPGLHQLADLPTVSPGTSDVVLEVRVPRTTRVSGRVFLPDGAPAEGVLVQASGQGKIGWGGPSLTRTKADGSYALRLQPDQIYMIGLLDPRGAAPPRSGVIVREGVPQERIDFRMVAGRTLSGRVTDWEGRKPVAGARVTLTVHGEMVPEEFQWIAGLSTPLVLRFWAFADDSGRYEFRLAPGKFDVWTDNYEASLTMKPDDRADIVRDLRVKEPAGPRFEAVSGMVVDRTGAGRRPIANARVRVMEFGVGSMSPAVTFSDADGRFVLQMLQTLWRPKFLYAESLRGELAGFATVAEGAKEVEVAVAAAALARGKVVDEAGRPVPDRKVQLQFSTSADREAAGRFVRLTWTDERGVYEFPGLAPGSFAEVMVPHGAHSYVSVQSFKVHGPGLIAVPDAVITLEKKVRPAVAAKPAGPRASVQGGVYRPMPYLITAADVEALIKAIGRDAAMPELIDKIGVFVRPQFSWVTDLQSITRLATDPEFRERVDRASTAVRRKPADTETLVELAWYSGVGHDDRTLVEFLRGRDNEAKSRTVQGRVFDAATGRPLAGATVFGPSGLTRTDGNGMFTLTYRPESSRQVPWIEAEGYALAEVEPPAGGRDAARWEIGLTREAPITGVVSDRDGHPIAGAVLWAMVNHRVFDPRSKGKPERNDSYGVPITALTDASGRFVLHGMPEGAELTWYEARHPRYQTARGREPLSASREVHLVMDRGCTVEGIIVDESGRGIAGAAVELRKEGQGRTGHESSTYSDREGRYHLADVAPGRWLLVVQPEQHAATRLKVVAAPERPARTQVVVEPGAFLAGKVIDEQKHPVPRASVGWVVPVTDSGERDRDFELNRMTVADEDGTFRIGPLPEGRFRLTAHSEAGMGKADGRANQTDLIIAVSHDRK